MSPQVSLAVAAIVYAPAVLAMAGLAVWVGLDAASQRTIGRHRANQVIEGELVEDTVPLPVGRWSR